MEYCVWKTNKLSFWKVILSIIIIVSTVSQTAAVESLEYMITQQKDGPFFVNATAVRGRCRLEAADYNMHDRVVQFLERGTQLIEFHLELTNSSVNYLLANTSWSYRPEVWARTSTQHGQTLLSLAFNYGVLSLGTLTVGVEKLEAKVVDYPLGCSHNLTEEEKMIVMLELLLRDFEVDGKYMNEEENICHQFIQNLDGYANFVNLCCKKAQRMANGVVTCSTDITNIWISIISALLKIIKASILLFGPLLMPGWLFNDAIDSIKYLVKLKEPIYKKIWISNDGDENVVGKKTLDLRLGPRFRGCLDLADTVPKNELLDARITEYRIWVNYKRLLTENKVPVGLMSFLGKALFFCKLGQTEPCRPCCSSRVIPQSDNISLRWITFWKFVGKILVVLCIPLPVYIHVFVYYNWEYKEIQDRKNLIARLGLKEIFDFRLFHYLGPNHPFLVFLYFLYYSMAFLFTIMETKTTTGRGTFQRVLYESLRDVKKISWVNALGLVVTVFLLPFKKFGCLGLFVAFIYWPLAVPIVLLAFCFYILPLVYVTFRMFIHSHTAVSRLNKTGKNHEDNGKPSYHRGWVGTIARHIADLELNKQLNAISPTMESDEYDDEEDTDRKSTYVLIRNKTLHILASAMYIVTLWTIMLLAAECLGFITEICVFTLMGVIVNAGSLLRYVTLIILVTLYSYDCYNNVQKRYMKLNKALFNEIKGQIKDLSEVTRLPSNLQENRGFKACENSEQGDYENADDVHATIPRHLFINDLILFVDKDDTPRIPLELFEEVCEIRVSGSPGPVWRSLLVATRDFLTMVVFLWFVFLVVASFGSMYRVSSGNQTMATLAGGFFPFLLRYLFKPTTSNLEIGTVSFKSKLDEIISAFNQPWPMYDFHFELVTEEERRQLDEGDDNKEENQSEEPKCPMCDHCNPAPLKSPTKSVGMQFPLPPPPPAYNRQNTLNNNGDITNIELRRKRRESEYIGLSRSEESIDTDVDLLVYLPQGKPQEWLREWSRPNSVLDLNLETIQLKQAADSQETMA